MPTESIAPWHVKNVGSRGSGCSGVKNQPSPRPSGRTATAQLTKKATVARCSPNRRATVAEQPKDVAGTSVVYSLRIQNLGSLTKHYGAGAGTSILTKAARQIVSHLGAVGLTVQFSGRNFAGFDLTIDEPSTSYTDFEDISKSCLLDALREISTTIFSDGKNKFLAAPIFRGQISLPIERISQDGDDNANHRSRNAAGPFANAHETADAYINEMAAAVDLVRRIRNGDVILSWKQVRSLTDRQEVSHYSAYLAELSTGGRPIRPACGEMAMERLGLTSTLELETLSSSLRTPSKPRAAPIAVVISPSTIANHGWLLGHMFAKHSKNGARNFFIIVRIDGFSDVLQLKRGLDIIRSWNLKIGALISNLEPFRYEDIALIEPDFIVIPPHFLRSIPNRPENALALSAIAALGRFASERVIVQGVDSQLLARHAIDAGIEWGEGNFLAPASWGRVSACAEA